jgi:cytochrome P450
MQIMNSIPDAVTEWLMPAARPILRFKRVSFQNIVHTSSQLAGSTDWPDVSNFQHHLSSQCLPNLLLDRLNYFPSTSTNLSQDQWNLIGRTMRGETIKSNDAKRTIFHEILSSKLPPEDKTQVRLADEAQIVIGGGVETTAFSLSIAAFHIINTPHIYAHLHADLVAAFPDAGKLELYPLEQMPYLKAIIMEAVRLSYGLSARNPRTWKKVLRYKDWVIPSDTCVVSLRPLPNVHRLTVTIVHDHPRSLARRIHFPRFSLLHPRALARRPEDT